MKHRINLHILSISALARSQLTNETTYKGLQIFPQNLNRQKRNARGKLNPYTYTTYIYNIHI